MTDPTQRFSSRVATYIKYRPPYPPAVLELLKAECHLSTESVIADVGSGTGLLSELLLHNGNQVFGIEPNPAMRAAGEHLLNAYPRFTSVSGTAEATTLNNHSVDFVMAGQAFHWFDQAKARAEFGRILSPAGWVVLLWHVRRTSATPFLAAFEQCWQCYATDPTAVKQRPDYGAVMNVFFGIGNWRLSTLETVQVFDFEGLLGRVVSASLAPEPGHPNYEAMVATLSALYHAHQVNGTVRYEYDTIVYYGHLSHKNDG